MSQSTTERSAEIRKALKAKGWTSRDVSVRSDYYSMGSSIRITIKNPNVPSAAVEALANGHEDISRDQFGDILGGGNRYVFVNYSSEALEQMGAKFLPAVERAAAVTPANGSTLTDIDGTTYMLGRKDFGFSVWTQTSHLRDVYDVNEAARLVAVERINQEYRNELS